MRPHFTFNPWKYGLMSGAADMFGGLAHGLEMQMVLNNRLAAYQEKYAQMANVAKLKQLHGDLLDAQKRQYEMLKPKTRKFTDPNTGVPMEETYHYEPDSNNPMTAVKVSDGIVPLQRGETQADRIELERMRQGGSDARNAARIAARKGSADDGSKSESASRRSLQAAMDKFEGNLASLTRRDDVLKAEGINPDDPAANQKYLTKKEEETRKRLRLPTMAEDDAGASNDKTSNKQGFTAPNGQFYPNGTTITNPKGQTVKIVNGKPVADTGSSGSAGGVAANGGDSASAAGDGSGDAGDADNEDGSGAQAANDPEPPQSIDLSDPRMPVQAEYLKQLAENPDVYPPPGSLDGPEEAQNGPGLMDFADQSDAEDNTRDDEEDRQMLSGGLMGNAYV